MTDATDSPTRVQATTTPSDLEGSPDEAIVLLVPRSYATISDPTDPDGERVLELPQPEDGEEFKRLVFPADEWAAAEKLLEEHTSVDVIEDPTDRNLAETKTQQEIEAAWAQREVEKKEQRRAKTDRYDPATDRPANHQKLTIKDVYDRLCEAGEDDAAEQLREAHSVRKQNKLAKKLDKSRLERFGDGGD